MSLPFHVVRLHWRHPHFPVGREPLRLLFVSDLHCPGPGRPYAALADWMAERTWDVVLFGGDYQDGHGVVSDLAYRTIMGVLGSARPRWGVWGVTGNHDHPKFVERLAREPVIRLLENAWVHLDGDIYLAGIGDAWQDRDEPRRAVEGIPGAGAGGAAPMRFVLGITHSPDAAAGASAAGVDALFCGHTHGGQVVLPVVGAPVKRLKRDRRLLSGEFRLNRMLLHVSEGFGASLFALRYGTRSSVCEVTIEHGPVGANKARRIFPKGFWTRR